ncbi:MAG: hypothetical protein RMJ56_09140 [Gemmataceae bacterium]|nr:hypothetical protein [Gemmata sp.]MDW8197752.1 hypothetical protein [Gemmataceae bacterium]
MIASNDPSELLAKWVIQLRSRPPHERSTMIAGLLPLLANEAIPSPLRLAAAARAIESLPDAITAIRDIVAILSEGLPAVQKLQRLRDLQNRVEKSDALDALVDEAANEFVESCPRCTAVLPHADMVKHLWHEHRLWLVDGKTRRLDRIAQMRRAEYAHHNDPASFETVAELSERVLGQWAASTATPDETHALLTAAGQRGVALCPDCYADVPPALPPLPPPLALAGGRLAGDGHVVSVVPRVPPRLSATLVAAATLVLIGGFLHLGIGVVLALAAYGFTYFFCCPGESPDDAAITTAWKTLAPSWADRRQAARWLTRLCLTSWGRGDPLERANTLQFLVMRARSQLEELPLWAAAQSLQIHDSTRFGRDGPEGIAKLVGRALQGDRPAAFAEYVLAAYLSQPRPAGEWKRLRILMLAAAFAAGLTPRDVLAFAAAAPHVARAFTWPPHQLAMLYGIWTHQPSRPWKRIDEAQTVFEVAERSPQRACRLLLEEPGLLLVCTTAPELEEILGPVLVTLGGVRIGSETLLDANADIRMLNNGWELLIGTTRHHLTRPLAPEWVQLIKGWLRFRSMVLGEYPTLYWNDEVRVAPRLLAPFIGVCAECGCRCLPIVGTVARRVDPWLESGH